jgi:hypothetical protein
VLYESKLGRVDSPAVDKGTDWVLRVGGTVGIELSTLIFVGDVDLGEVTYERKLNIVRSLQERGSRDGAGGDRSRAIALLDTVADDTALNL